MHKIAEFGGQIFIKFSKSDIPRAPTSDAAGGDSLLCPFPARLMTQAPDVGTQAAITILILRPILLKRRKKYCTSDKHKPATFVLQSIHTNRESSHCVMQTDEEKKKLSTIAPKIILKATE